MNWGLFIGDPRPLRSAIQVVVVVVVVVGGGGVLYYAFSSLRRRPPESRATAQLIWLRIFASSEPRGLASSESSPAEIVVNLGCVASCRPAQIDLLVDRSLRFLLCHSKSDTSCCIACLRGTSGASLIS